jgi:hypothetical protein
MTSPANEARPENSVVTDERIRSDLARLLQDRLVRESRLGVWVHPDPDRRHRHPRVARRAA